MRISERADDDDGSALDFNGYIGLWLAMARSFTTW